MKILLSLFLTFLATFAFADNPPVPKAFKGLSGQKGNYQVEMLEGAGKSSGMQKMNICTDNLMKPPADNKGKPDTSCKHKLLKDTADEAVIESTCSGRTSVVTMKRESAKTMLMTMESTSQKGKPQTVKMRYTHLGACREGQGTMSLDPNGEQCRQMRAQAAQMDPKMRESMLAMCK
jgi:hypothetical protein